MKIGIITFQRAHNLGAQFQMYALYSFLRLQGHDVAILDYYCPMIEDGYIKEFPTWKRYVSKNIYAGLARLCSEIVGHFYYQKKKRMAFECFLNDFFVLTERFDAPNNLPTGFDVLITGSDQVWNYKLTGGRKEPYFLDNNREGRFPSKRIAYAPSIERSQFDSFVSDKEYINGILSKFDWVSVREKSLAELLKSTIDIKADTVIDPTFLLSREDYLKIAIRPQVSNFLCLYRVTQNKNLYKTAKKIAKERGLKIIYAHSSGITTDKAGAYGPREMLGLLCYADVIVTSSFHGTAFSIINRKDFYSVYDVPSVRVQDLLAELHLSERMITATTPYTSFSSITYDEQLIINYINHSKHLLLQSLKD